MSDSNRLHQSGIKQFRAGRYEEACQIFEEARDAAGAAGQKRKTAEILNDLGVTRCEMGQFDLAKSTLDEALILFETLDDVKGQAQAMGNLGNVFESLNEFEQAADAYRQSAQMFEHVGENDLAMYSWQALSRLHLKHKNWLPAIAAYEEGIENMPDGSPKKGLLKRIVNLPGNWLGK